MAHPLANIAFLLAGAATAALLGLTVEAHWPQIKRAILGQGW